MTRYLKLYGRFSSQYIKFMMQSKVNFFISIFSFLTMQASGLAFLYLIFEHIPKLNGWSFYEILFIYGFAQIPRGIDHVLTDNIWMLAMRKIVMGEFDRYLLRPVNPLFHLIAEMFQPDGLGEIIVGIVITIIAIIKLGIDITFFKGILFIIFVLAGVIIYTSIKLFFASIAFWIKDSMAILNLAYATSDFAKYPNEIYSKFVKTIITVIIPFAFTAYIPAAYFIGHTSLSLALFGTVGTAIISFTVAYCTWLRGITAYESAGS